MANSFAIEIASQEEDPTSGKMGNIRGFLGELLAKAALDNVSKKCFSHHLSANEEDRRGIDISVMNGQPYMIAGYGIKLKRSKEAILVDSSPILNLKISEDAFQIKEFVDNQKAGRLYSPEAHVDSIFCNSNTKQKFKELLFWRVNRAFDSGLVPFGTITESYYGQFL